MTDIQYICDIKISCGVIGDQLVSHLKFRWAVWILIISWQIDGETVATVSDFIFWAPKSLQIVTAAMKLEDLTPWEESYDQPRQHIKKQRHYFANKGPSSQGYGFPVVMYGCESLCRKLSTKEFMLLNGGIGENSWESLGLQGDPTSPS